MFRTCFYRVYYLSQYILMWKWMENKEKEVSKFQNALIGEQTPSTSTIVIEAIVEGFLGNGSLATGRCRSIASTSPGWQCHLFMNSFFFPTQLASDSIHLNRLLEQCRAKQNPKEQHQHYKNGTAWPNMHCT